jgi:hypothetical protein
MRRTLRSDCLHSHCLSHLSLWRACTWHRSTHSVHLPSSARPPTEAEVRICSRTSRTMKQELSFSHSAQTNGVFSRANAVQNFMQGCGGVPLLRPIEDDLRHLIGHVHLRPKIAAHPRGRPRAHGGVTTCREGLSLSVALRESTPGVWLRFTHRSRLDWDALCGVTALQRKHEARPHDGAASYWTQVRSTLSLTGW